MVSRRLLLGATIGSLLLGLLGLFLYGQQRIDRCAGVPLVATNLLPNANLQETGEIPDLPRGWASAAPGVRLGDFTVLPGGHSLQLIGIANYVQTPTITPVRPGQSYCFSGQAITDSTLGSATRVRLIFQWLNGAGQLLGEDLTPWQPVVLWQPDRPPPGWSVIGGAFHAPQGATGLRVRVAPASDDRIYLDQMRVQVGGLGDSELSVAHPQSLVSILPWPAGHHAALSFSFDWETAMGGLVHSCTGDPNSSQDYLLRGMRMRQGVTTTLEIFRPYQIRATYYATGYNFLFGNSERRSFMNNPTFSWANGEPGHCWSNNWCTRPWFADDPYGTVRSDPAWYFGDLVALLRQERQDIQSHTFSHLYGGYASAAEWQADFTTWDQVAAAQGVPSAHSLAFPWSGSGGMSDANWNMLEAAGIRSVTRLSDQSQYSLAPYRDPHCRPVPGHERILACPDFYLTPHSVAQAQQLIDATLAVSGTLDLWAHTEEVTSPEQIAAWREVVSYAAARPDLWIAPLSEITSWQAAVQELRIENVALRRNAEVGESLSFSITNGSDRALAGLTLALPFSTKRISIAGKLLDSRYAMLNSLELDLAAGETVEVAVWPI